MEFTQKQVAKITEVNAGTLQVWARDGLIIPSIANTRGRGTSRLYSPADLVHVAVIKILSEMSFNRYLILSLSQQLNIKAISVMPDDHYPEGGISGKDLWFDPFYKPGEATTQVLAVSATQNHWTFWGFSTTAGRMLDVDPKPKGEQPMPLRDAVLIINLVSIKDRIRKAIA